MKKAFIVIICLVLLCSCARTDGIEKTLDTYVKGLQEFDFEIMNSCMANEPDEMKNSFEGPIYAYVIESCKAIKLVSKNISIYGDTATADVTFTFPDTSVVLLSAMQRYVEKNASLGGDLSTENKNELLADCLAQVNVEAQTKTVSGIIYLEKIGSDWKISDISEELVAVIGCNYLEAFEMLKSAY